MFQQINPSPYYDSEKNQRANQKEDGLCVSRFLSTEREAFRIALGRELSLGAVALWLELRPPLVQHR
jgi:hypothetical protein